MVCNSGLNPLDVQTARAAKSGMHREWCASLPVEIGTPMKARLQRLYEFLQSGLLKVKVLPDEAFGLIHGKAGVITRTDGLRVCFIGGARYVLADQVGLGKTIQLALAAKLMALYGDRPILILVPKPLMIQWQDELWNLLEMPSARWNGGQWIDEQGVVYPEFGPQGMRRCPRRIGIMSTGLIIRGSETVDWESCSRVLDSACQLEALRKGW